MSYIKKSTFFNYLNCPTLGWLSKHKKIKEKTGLKEKLLFFEWRDIHNRAYELFPDAINAQINSPAASAQNTNELLQNPNNKTITCAYFTASNFIARVDVVKRCENSNELDLIEIKLGKISKLKYIKEMAYISMVLLKSGMNINTVSMMLLNTGYKFGVDVSQMFSSFNCTRKVEEKTLEYILIADKVEAAIESENMPSPKFNKTCNKCFFFSTCFGTKYQNLIFDLPKLSPIVIDELIEKNIFSIEEIPDDIELTKMQQIVKTCVQNNSVYISPTLKDEIDAIKPPYYYLDFESINTAIPLYPNVPSRSQIINQYSIHKSLTIDGPVQHFEYIATGEKDDQYQIAKNLVDVLGQEGSIMTYAPFEKIVIERFTLQFPNLKNELLSIVARIVDLEKIIRENYYDIRFHGRSSIKTLLPILTKDTTYNNLEISKGGDAAAFFTFMAMGIYDATKSRKIKEYLLKYCAQDTMALLELHQFLFNVVNHKK
ncbi:MAG: DUF2779 domain-containing protein [Elusimicrobiota bacterium]|jgi:CRISPR/Cas system-associated exonuclease Cas4 (RecB family)|nr:DUF2779 domain-containing protein [Elusimicrobiota bacterium]